MMPLHKGCLAYAATAFGSSIMNSVFMFFYVKVFLTHYHVSQGWFQASQAIFMIWNAINDPLFGYFQDNSNWRCFKSRRLSILYGAPLYVISFMVPWIPWSTNSAWATGLHLTVSLCFYDALLTFVLLAHCCLITEMNVSYEERLRMKWYGVIASGLLSTWAVPMANFLSDNLNRFHHFQGACLLIAAVAYVAMTFTGRNAFTVYDRGPNPEEGRAEAEAKQCQGSVVELTKQILRERDFEAFVWTNFAQIFHSTFLANFTAIFIDSFVEIDSISKNAYFACLFVFPSLAIILGKRCIQSFGYYRIIKWTCYLKFLVPIGCFLYGYQRTVYLVFVLFDTTSVNAVFSLYDLCLSDIADKDKAAYRRSHPVSSMIFGTNALITKPAISLAPMLVTHLLSVTNKDFSQINKLSVVERQWLGQAMFQISCAVPFFVGAIQLVTWSFYTIRSSHKGGVGG